jgi:hypothetical protein
MRHQINLGNWKSIIGTTVLAAGLTLFAGAGTAKADDCQERIGRADHHLHEAGGTRADGITQCAGILLGALA